MSFSLHNHGTQNGALGYEESTAGIRGFDDGHLELLGTTGIRMLGTVDMTGNKISGLADGLVASGSKEAVTGNQLYNAINSGAGMKYFHANSTGPDSVAGASNSVAIGPGASVAAAAQNSVALGYYATVTANAATTGMALGTGAKSDATDASAIGRDTVASAADTVALGHGAVANRANTVSIGKAGGERQLVNLAKGTLDTDAVNVSQLKGVTAAIGGGSTVDASGNVTKPSYTVDGKAVTGVDGAIAALDKKSGDINPLAVAYDTATKDKITLAGGSAGTTITNLKAGVVSSSSKDAINGTQLYNTASSVAAALGGGSTVDANGSVTKPTYTVDGKPANGVDGAVNALDTRISSITTDIAPKLKYIKFGPTSASDAGATGKDAVAIGGASTANGNGALAIGAGARAMAVNAVAVGIGSSTSIENTFAVGSSTSKRRIVNVDNGVDLSDAATVGQVDAKIAQALGDGVKSSGGLLKASGNPLTVDLLGASSVPLDKLIVAGPDSGDLTATEATGSRAIAMGLNVAADADDAVAAGQNINVLGANSVAVGQNLGVTAAGSTAIGSSVSVASEDAVAIGSAGTEVNFGATGAVAIGRKVSVGGEGTVGIGSNIVAAAKGSVVLGANSSDDNRANTVSVGASAVPGMGTGLVRRQVINVAAGTQDTDAVNVSQLKGVTTALGGGAGVNADGSIKAPKYTVGGKDYSDVGSAINAAAAPLAVAYDTTAKDKVTLAGGSAGTTITNVKDGNVAAGSKDVVTGNQLYNAINSGTGTKYFHANSTSADSSAATAGSVAIGGKAVAGGGAKSIAIGESASAAGAYTSYGSDGAYNIAIGAGANADGSNGNWGHNTAVGGNAKANNVSDSAFGYGAEATGNSATALGSFTKATASNATALGFNTLADRANTVSVGSGDATTGFTRQIVNVAKGTLDNDAVNVSQLKGVTTALGGGSTVDASGNVTKPSYTVDGKAVTGVDGAITALDKKAGAANPLAVAYDTTTKDKITLAGGSAGTMITNLKDGNVAAGSKDAVTGNQLNTTNQNVTNLTNNINNGTVGLVQQAAKGQNLTVGKATDGVAVDFTNSALATRQLKGVSAGVVSSSSKDAINGAQLFNTAGSVAAALGGGSTVDANGNVTMPTYTVDGKPVNGVDGAVNALDTRITNVSKDMVEIAPKLKYIKFGQTSATDAGATGKDAVAIGGASAANGNGALAIGAGARAMAVNAVAVGIGSSTSIENTFAVGSSTSKRRIVNVDNGVDLSDAATVGQVDAKIAQALSDGVKSSGGLLKASGNPLTVGLLGASSLPPDKLIVAGPDSGDLTSTEATGSRAIAMGLNVAADADDAVAAGQNINVLGANSVAVGQNLGVTAAGSTAIGSSVSVASEDAVAIGSAGTEVNFGATGAVAIGRKVSVGGEGTVGIGSNIVAAAKGSVVLGVNSSDDNRANTVSVGSAGTLEGTSKIKRQVINVAAGTQDTDAVNVSQLKSVATAIGGGSTVGADGLVTLPTYKIGGKDTTGTLAEGINKLDQRITDGAGGTPNPLAVAYDTDAKNLITLGKDGGTAKITHLADGNVASGSTDAVNGGQLHTVAKGLADVIGGGAAVGADGKITAPEFSVGDQKPTTVAGAVDALDTRIDGVAGDVTNITNNYTKLAGDTLKWDADATGGAAYSAKHGAQAESRITNVANATEGGDAVNKRSLDAAIAEVSTKADPSSVKYDSLETKDKVTFGGLKDGKPATAPVKLTNVAAATGDTDAVNFKQFKDAGLIDTGTGKALDAVVYDANTAKAAVTFGGANGTVLSNVANGQVGENSRQAVNGSQLFKLQSELGDKITNIDNRVTNIENGPGTGSAPYVTANPEPASRNKPTPANAGTTPGIAVGYSASASGENASAMGDHAVAQAKDSVAIGNGSTVTETATNSVALGNNSVADSANTISVGATGSERTISHVARGNADTDAATMGQVRETLNDAKAYTDSKLNDVWQQVGEEIDHVNRQANRGIAAASALINVTPYVPGHTTVNAGMAGYRGEAALGIGVSRWSENGRVNFNAGVSAAKDDEPVFRVGVGYIF